MPLPRRRRGVRHAFVPSLQNSDVGTLYVGLSDELERVLELEAEARSARDSVSEAVIRELGELYGYPACCARAFAQSPFGRIPRLLRWAFVYQRTSEDEPCDPRLSPFALPDCAFAPCSLSCTNAVQRYGEWFRAIGEELFASLDHRHVFFVPVGDESPPVFVSPGRVLGDGFSYRRADVRGEAPLRTCFHNGNRIRYVSVQVQILSEERVVHVFTASLFPWDSHACFAREEWREVARAALAQELGQRLRGPSTENQTTSVDGHEGPAIRVLVNAPSGFVDFYIAALPAGRPAYIRRGKLALWYGHGQLTDEAQDVAEALAHLMETQQGRPLEASVATEWAAALTSLTAGSGLERRVSWKVEWVPPPASNVPKRR